MSNAMESKKRERSSNFNTAEVRLLVSLVDKYKNIIENKKTDAVTNKDKESAWRKIENAFNSCGLTTNNRSWKTLKLKYEGLKKITKKKSSLQRQEMYRTGGGPSNAPDFNDVEEKVLSICSNIKGLEARHDSDTITSEPMSQEVVFLETLSAEINIVEDINDTEQQNEIVNTTTKLPDMDESFISEINEENHKSEKENKWDKWHPNTLKTRVSNVLRTNAVTKSSVTKKLDELSSARLELVQLQMETANKEQQFLEEEHKLKIISFQNDERRKQELHEALLQKIKCTPLVNNVMQNSL